jgi:8-oxo-dGTP pyrophosphatase MutT (NUDIX family)
VARRNGPWTIHASREAFRHATLQVREDEVTRPDGEPGTFATVHTPPGVAALVVDQGGFVCLVRQYRYVVEQFSIEAACGAIEPGETPLEAAMREAREELGAEGGEWIDLGLMDADTSIFLNRVRLFLGRGVRLGQPDREGTEVMETLRVPFAEAVRLAMDGEITHAVTALLLLKAERWLASEHS